MTTAISRELEPKRAHLMEGPLRAVPRPTHHATTPSPNGGSWPALQPDQAKGGISSNTQSFALNSFSASAAFKESEGTPPPSQAARWEWIGRSET